MSAQSKADYEAMIRLRKLAFKHIADALGEGHPAVSMMGALAWGRHKFERGPDAQGLRDAVEEYAYLEGYFEAMNMWARDHDRDAQRTMLDIWPRGRQHA